MKSLEFKAYDILQKYNFSKEDAEALIEYMKEASKEEVATKKDIESLKNDIAFLKHDAEILRSEFKIANSDTKSSMIQWMAGLMIGQIALIFSIFKLFDKL
ncbi:MAG: cytochrome P450 [Cytophagales bacterium]|nr:cytochrome P450 [Cytophagales bacterium]